MKLKGTTRLWLPVLLSQWVAILFYNSGVPVRLEWGTTELNPKTGDTVYEWHDTWFTLLHKPLTWIQEHSRDGLISGLNHVCSFLFDCGFWTFLCLPLLWLAVPLIGWLIEQKLPAFPASWRGWVLRLETIVVGSILLIATLLVGYLADWWVPGATDEARLNDPWQLIASSLKKIGPEMNGFQALMCSHAAWIVPVATLVALGAAASVSMSLLRWLSGRRRTVSLSERVRNQLPGIAGLLIFSGCVFGNLSGVSVVESGRIWEDDRAYLMNPERVQHHPHVWVGRLKSVQVWYALAPELCDAVLLAAYWSLPGFIVAVLMRRRMRKTQSVDAAGPHDYRRLFAAFAKKTTIGTSLLVTASLLFVSHRNMNAGAAYAEQGMGRWEFLSPRNEVVRLDPSRPLIVLEDCTNQRARSVVSRFVISRSPEGAGMRQDIEPLPDVMTLMNAVRELTGTPYTGAVLSALSGDVQFPGRLSDFETRFLSGASPRERSEFYVKMLETISSLKGDARTFPLSRIMDAAPLLAASHRIRDVDDAITQLHKTVPNDAEIIRQNRVLALRHDALARSGAARYPGPFDEYLYWRYPDATDIALSVRSFRALLGSTERRTQDHIDRYVQMLLKPKEPDGLQSLTQPIWDMRNVRYAERDVFTFISGDDPAAKRLLKAHMDHYYENDEFLESVRIHRDVAFASTRLHLAIRSYEFAHAGTPPARLEALVPGYLREIPAFPWMTNCAVRYLVEGTNWVVFCDRPARDSSCGNERVSRYRQKVQDYFEQHGATTNAFKEALEVCTQDRPSDPCDSSRPLQLKLTSWPPHGSGAYVRNIVAIDFAPPTNIVGITRHWALAYPSDAALRNAR